MQVQEVSITEKKNQTQEEIQGKYSTSQIK